MVSSIQKSFGLSVWPWYSLLVWVGLLLGIEGIWTWVWPSPSANAIGHIQHPIQVKDFYTSDSLPNGSAFNNNSRIQVYKPFNPNAYQASDWESIGFSEKQAQTIIKYRHSLGGAFTDVHQIQKCFVIDAEAFEIMKPWIRLSDLSPTPSENPSTQYGPISPFDPNVLSISQWMELGFSNAQAQSILRYKSSLGGEFKSVEQIQKCYTISPNQFERLKPYIRLKTNVHSSEMPIWAKQAFNPDTLRVEHWQALGFTDKQVSVIFNYKRSLGGKFGSYAVFARCYVMTDLENQPWRQQLRF